MKTRKELELKLNRAKKYGNKATIAWLLVEIERLPEEVIIDQPSEQSSEQTEVKKLNFYVSTEEVKQLNLFPDNKPEQLNLFKTKQDPIFVAQVQAFVDTIQKIEKELADQLAQYNPITELPDNLKVKKIKAQYYLTDYENKVIRIGLKQKMLEFRTPRKWFKVLGMKGKELLMDIYENKRCQRAIVQIA